MPMTGRSLAIASSTRRTDLRRPTSMGMIAPGNSTELRSGRIGSVSGISTGCSPPALALVMDRKLATQVCGRQGDLPVMTGSSRRSHARCDSGGRPGGLRDFEHTLRVHVAAFDGEPRAIAQPRAE